MTEILRLFTVIVSVMRRYNNLVFKKISLYISYMKQSLLFISPYV